MRILFVLRTIHPDYGGPLEGTREIAGALGRAGHTAEVAHLDPPDGQTAAYFNVPVHALGPSQGAYGYSARLAPWIRQNASRFDAVIVNGLWHYPGVGVWRGLSGLATPYFVFTHGSLHPWFRRASRLKDLQRTLYWKFWESRVLLGAQAVLFTSQEELELARNAYAPFPRNLQVVPYCSGEPPDGLAALAEKFLARYPALRGCRIVLFLGRIHPVKGCDLLVEAFGAVAGGHPDLRLVIAGPDPVGLTPGLRARAAALGLGTRVVFTGLLQGDEKWGAYAASRLFASTSHAECFGVSLAAALACGVPAVISTEVNTWREITEEGAGFAAPSTVEGAVSLLRRWLAATPEQLDTMKGNAVRAYKNRYTPYIAAQGLVLAILGQLVPNGGNNRQ